MDAFVTQWADAALTTLGWFWTAFWAFGLGYVVSAMIQVFVSRERMRRAIGDTNLRTVGLASMFGFISSSCSFAALATTRSLIAKGAGLVPALAFLLASTNLVIELGIIIAVFLSWQFVVGEYVGGFILIGATWAIVRMTRPDSLVAKVQKRLDSGQDGEVPDWRRLITSQHGWIQVAKAYLDEWLMVWKDVTVGFTVAGIIAVFLPDAFFTTIFPSAGAEGASFLAVLGDAVVGPVAAFFTFIGSMGNIPLASVLLANGVSVAGIMAFIFSDLVVFPVLRVNAVFYGWKFSLYIAGVFLFALVATAIVIHYGFALFGVAPEAGGHGQPEPTSRFAIDYTFFLNLAFLSVSAGFAWLAWGPGEYASDEGMDMRHGGLIDRALWYLAIAAYVWLAGGLAVFLLAPLG